MEAETVAPSSLTARASIPAPSHHPPDAWAFRPDVEGLRAVAIVGVVLFHAGWTGAVGGYLGVDVFFVLSGFLITGILIDEASRTGTISLTNFWARRARRLLPASLFMTTIALLVGASVVSPHAQAINATTARSFSVYASNIRFTLSGNDYFATQTADDALLHTWSLSVEEQFYLVFAPLVLLSLWRTRVGAQQLFRRRIGAGLVGVVVLSFAACLLLVDRRPQLAFYMLPTRAWEFAIGALIALGIGRLRRLPVPVANGLALVSFAGLLYALHAFSRELAHPSWMTLLPTLATGGLLVSGTAAPSSLVARGLSTSPLRLLGRLSYSWYLWHWPLLVFLAAWFPGVTLTARLAVAFGSLLVAAVTYRVVERPIRYSRKLRARPGLTILGAVAASLATFAISIASRNQATRRLAEPRFQTIEEVRRAVPRPRADGCLGVNPLTLPTACEYGDASGSRSVVLFGDSHALQWFPAVDSIARVRHWRLEPLLMPACPPMDVIIPGRRAGSLEGRRCARWRANAYRYIARTHPDEVIVAEQDHLQIVLGWRVASIDDDARARRRYTAAFGDALDRLGRSTSRLILLRDTPGARFDIPDCVESHMKNVGQCDLRERDALTPAVASLERAVADTRHVAYVDLTPLFCSGGTCAVLRGDMLRYRDGSHISVAFALALTHPLDSALARARSLPEHSTF